MFILTRDVKCTRTINVYFAFAKQSALHILSISSIVSRTIRKIIGSSVSKLKSHFFLTLTVDCCTISISYIHTVQGKNKLCGRINLETTIGGCTCKAIFHFCGACGVHSDVSTNICDRNARKSQRIDY